MCWLFLSKVTVDIEQLCSDFDIAHGKIRDKIMEKLEIIHGKIRHKIMEKLVVILGNLRH